MQNPSYKKILFSDIDETLVTTDKKLTDENRAAIMHFLDAGNALAVSAGRALAGALHLMERLGSPDGRVSISAPTMVPRSTMYTPAELFTEEVLTQRTSGRSAAVQENLASTSRHTPTQLF